jgi:SAM-dependent methyltransferase
MTDVYATISAADRAVQCKLAEVIEARAADPRYQAMLHDYLEQVRFPPHARVLEPGCGTGFVIRLLSRWPNVGTCIGVDPSPVFIETARTLAAGIANASFVEGDGRELPFDAATFDAVIINTTVSHVPEPERLLAEAHRVLRGGGWLAVFDGDYSTATVSKAELDPLSVCVAAFRTGYVNDAWIVRRLPQLVRGAGFCDETLQSHGYAEAPVAGYLMSWIDRGADVLVQHGCIASDTAEALKAEARRRSDAREWFGHIAFASVIARKPPDKAPRH